MWESLQIPENYAMAGIDTLVTYVLSSYPFGLKDIISLFFSKEATDKEALNKYLPLEIIIKKLEKQLVNKEYEKLDENNVQLEILCNKLQTTIKKDDAFNHLKNELNLLDFNNEFSFEQYQQIINLLTSSYLNDNDFLSKLNQSSATDLENEDYSLHNMINNSWSNIKFFLIALIINHLVITGASAYTAETLTWETYKNDIISINNIISTVIRGTIMKLVNDYFIKNSLSTLFKPIMNYLWPNNNKLLEHFKDWVKDQKKLKQVGIFIFSFIFITFISNAIKTYAADVTQNKGDWKKAYMQFAETFLKWGMLASAFCVTSSDLYNLTNKIKPVFKLIYKEKEQQKIIDEVLSKLSNINSHENTNDSNGENTDGIIRANGDFQINLESDNIQEIVNNSNGKCLTSNNNTIRNTSVL